MVCISRAAALSVSASGPVFPGPSPAVRHLPVRVHEKRGGDSGHVGESFRARRIVSCTEIYLAWPIPLVPGTCRHGRRECRTLPGFAQPDPGPEVVVFGERWWLCWPVCNPADPGVQNLPRPLALRVTPAHPAAACVCEGNEAQVHSSLQS